MPRTQANYPKTPSIFVLVLFIVVLLFSFTAPCLRSVVVPGLAISFGILSISLAIALIWKMSKCTKTCWWWATKSKGLETHLSTGDQILNPLYYTGLNQKLFYVSTTLMYLLLIENILKSTCLTQTLGYPSQTLWQRTKKHTECFL